MPEFSSVVTLGGFPALVADPAIYPLAAGKANSFRFVVGPSHGSGYVLMLRRDLNRAGLRKGGPVELVFSAGGKKIRLRKVWVIAAHRANPGGRPDDPDAAYLCRVVDWRYFLNRWSTGVRSINCRNWAGGDPDRYYLRDTIKAADTPHSWNEALKLLWGDVVGLGAFRNVVGIRTPPPEDLHNPGGNAWRFLCDVVAQASRTIVYDPEADTYSIRKLTIDATPLDKEVAADLEYDARPWSPPAAVAPEKIRVYFARRLEDYGTEADTPAVGNWATNAAFTWLDIPTRTPEPIRGTIATVWASTPAVVKHRTRDTYLNAAEMKATAQELADGWLLANGAEALSRAHLLLNGIQKSWLPSDSIRETIVRDMGDGLLTEVLKYPGMPENLPDFAVDADNAGADVEGENFAPIDTARRTLPNYPRLPNIVEVFDSGQAAGAIISANSSGVHPGYVRRVVAGNLERLEKCWLLLVDDYTVNRGQVPAKNGDLYGPARLSGKHEYGGLRLPLYVARSSSASSEIVRFRLLSNLQPGGSALAVEIAWNATTRTYNPIPDRPYIVVVDWYSTPRGMWQAPAIGSGLLGGASSSTSYIEGLAIRRGTVANTSIPFTTPATPEFEIVWMETLAWECEGYISSAPSGTIATGTVTAAWEQGKHPGETITIHDDQEFFPRWANGAKFKATRCEHNGQGALGLNYWKVTNCQQICITAQATLAADMCGSSATLVDGSFTPTSPSPFNLAPDPLPTSALNPRGHYGLSGDQVVLQWAGGWQVIDVTKHPTAVVIDQRYASRKLEIKRVTAALELCSSETPAWETILTAAPCTPP